MIPPSSKQQWAAMLKQVSRRKDAHQGKEIHSEIIRAGQDEDILLTSSLLQMYGKCGEVQRARLTFDTIASPDAFTLTMMIAAYADNGQLLQARSCFKTIENPSVVCCNAMLAAYKTSGITKQAYDFFRKLPVKDVATWNTIISANSQSSKALYLFRSIDLEGLDPNAISFVTALEGCSSIEDVRGIHRRLIDHRLSDAAAEVLKVGNALIGGYGKWSQAEEAENVFQKMTIRNVVSWTSLITAYAFDLPKALVTFQRMNLCGEKPNEVTMISVFHACANAGALAIGKHYHSLLKTNNNNNVVWMQELNLGNAIVSFYSKCGEFDRAQAAFQEMQRRDVVSFNVLIAANGQPLQALRLAKEMRLEGIDPNRTSFTAMFAACNHAGLLEEAVLQLISMKDDFAIDPCVEHYVCVADLLGRGGRIAEAEELILEMPFEADYVAWTILLDACRSHGDLERAERASQRMQLLKPANSSPYVLLFNTRIDETSS